MQTFMFRLSSFLCTVTYVKTETTSPTWNAAPFGDLDALITVEITFMNNEKVDENLQMANIQFNNLDIIGTYLLS